MAHDFISLVGNTPLIRLKRASDETGCEILGKAEFLNPGGSVKDRAALAIIKDGINNGLLKPGGTIVEGTAGNTGIGLALVGNALGYKTVIVIPETQSQEKKDLLRMAGAQLICVPAVPYTNPDNYIRQSERLAKEKGAFWANQFDNVANREGHRTTTAPEIWAQTEGKVNAFVSAVGTGGTLCGTGMGLKEKNPDIKLVLADPYGSAIYSHYATGELKIEGGSITEGIGQARITKNLEGAPVDMWFKISDEEALKILYALNQEEGLILGGSSAINVAGAIKTAQALGPGHTIVTLLCDHGSRYMSRLYNIEFLKARNLPIPTWMA